MASGRYRHELRTGSGSTRADLLVQENGEVTCDLHQRWMGVPERQYHLRGRYEDLSPTCGRIFIRHVSVQQAAPSAHAATLADVAEEDVDLTALGTSLMYEAIMVARTPVLYHPDDVLTMMAPLGYAQWNEYFDVIIMTSPFVMQALDALKTETEQETDTTILSASMPSISDRNDEVDETSAVPGDEIVEHLEELAFTLDKMKFVRLP